MNSDLKEFWDSFEDKAITKGTNIKIKQIREAQGLFFWERGGKQFVEGLNPNCFVKYILIAEECVSAWNDCFAKDFLDSIDCLGEPKVKELIKELEVKSK